MEAGLPLIEDEQAIQWLKAFYGVGGDDELRRRAYDDWRLCLPRSIADEDGVIPRTPVVFLENDPRWFRADELTGNLRSLIE